MVPAAERARIAPPEPSRFAGLPERASIGEQRGDLFGSRSWNPPKAPVSVVPPVPAAVDVAPPNPYKVAGTLVQDGGKRVFLAKGERIYEAKEGEGLDDGYRVHSIAAAQVVLVHVASGAQEALPIVATLGADVPVAKASTAGAPLAQKAMGREKPVHLQWEGPERVRAGTSFTVSLRATSTQPLRSSPMQVTYEPALLHAVDVRAGKFFGQGSFSYRQNEGSIFIGASGAGDAPGAGAELLVITFRPMKSGAVAEVRLSTVALQGASGHTLAHNPVSAFRTSIQ